MRTSLFRTKKEQRPLIEKASLLMATYYHRPASLSRMFYKDYLPIPAAPDMVLKSFSVVFLYHQRRSAETALALILDSDGAAVRTVGVVLVLQKIDPVIENYLLGAVLLEEFT